MRARPPPVREKECNTPSENLHVKEAELKAREQKLNAWEHKLKAHEEQLTAAETYLNSKQQEVMGIVAELQARVKQSNSYNTTIRAEAKVIVDKIFANVGRKQLEPLTLIPGLSVVDVQEDTEQFSNDKGIFKTAGLTEAPCLNIDSDHYVPISIPFLIGHQYPRYHSRSNDDRKQRLEFLITEELVAALDEIKSYKSKQFTMVDVAAADQAFRNLASDFLAVRMAALGESDSINKSSSGKKYKLALPTQRGFGSPDDTDIVDGCLFTVTTDSPGLRVLWSGAYFMRARTFGGPTSPVSTVLQSGTYLFGVDGGAYGSTPEWDHVEVTIPGTPRSLGVSMGASARSVDPCSTDCEWR